MENSENKIIIDLSSLGESGLAGAKIALYLLLKKEIESYQEDLNDIKSIEVDETTAEGLDRKITIEAFSNYITVLEKAITENKLDEYYKEFINTTEVREITDDSE